MHVSRVFSSASSPERVSPFPNKRSTTKGKSRIARPVALPQISASQTVRTTLRFQVVGGQSNVCTSQSILQACGGIAIDSSTYQAWASTARVHRVRLYAIDPTIPVTLRLTWGNGGWVGVAKDVIVSDTSLGFATPAVIDTVPPDGTLASDWFAYQSGRPDDTIFDFDVIGSSTSRAFLDITVSFTFDMSNPSIQQVPQLTPISTSLTASKVYWASVCPTNSSVNQMVLPSFT